MLDFGLILFYALFGLGTLAAIGFAVYHLVSKPGALVRAAIVLGALLVLFGLSYALSGSEVNDVYRAQGVTESTSKLIGAGLIMFYLAFFIAIAALVYTEISKAFK